MYLSQIISTRCTLCNWLLIYGKLNSISMVKKCFTCSRWFQYIFTRAAPSISIASTVGVIDVFSVRFSRHFSKSDFTICGRSPNFEMEGGYAWFSWAKNSSRLPWRTWQEMCNWENREQFCFREVTSSFSFEGDFLGLLNNANLLSFITSVTSFLCFIRHSSKNIWNCSWPAFSIPLTVVTTCVLAISLVSRTSRSSLSSLKGFPKVSKEWTRALTCVWNLYWTLFICSWWWTSGPLLCFVLIASWIDSNSVISLAISGPDTIHLRSWAEFSVNPTAPPSPMITKESRIHANETQGSRQWGNENYCFILVTYIINCVNWTKHSS